MAVLLTWNVMRHGVQVRGAVDDLDRVLAILAKTGYTEDRFYIHCDGALFGLMVPPPLPPGPIAVGLLAVLLKLQMVPTAAHP